MRTESAMFGIGNFEKRARRTRCWQSRRVRLRAQRQLYMVSMDVCRCVAGPTEAAIGVDD